MPEIPLGRREDGRLEFKGRAVLDKPEGRQKVAREVVAMLNSEGGEVWIGLREENGFAVEVEPLEDAPRQGERLLDALVDRIEPSPGSGELRVEPVPPSPGGEPGDLLRIEVGEGSRGPYALIGSGGTRTFLTRIGGRIRVMEREEVARAFGGTSVAESPRDEEIREARERLLGERREIEAGGGVLGGEDGFWMEILPVKRLELDLQRPELEEMLTDPTRTGNRRSGWTFVSFEKPELRPGGRLVGGWKPAEQSGRHGQEIEVRQDGTLTFKSTLSKLHWKGESNEIWPLILLELPISLFRLAGHVYRGHLADDDPVLADAALFGVAGWALRGGSPGGAHALNAPRRFEAASELILPGSPFRFPYREVREQPDHCGFRLVRQIYAEFGLREESVPREYDRETGRLVLPE